MNSLQKTCRHHILTMAASGGAFVGAAFSCVDILITLYTQLFDTQDIKENSPDRDMFILSKGHAVPALYAVMAEIGILDKALLTQHMATNSPIYWHPNKALPGIDFHSGSLGHGLSIAMGLVLAKRLKHAAGRVFVLLGDGELNEGTIWEGLLFANAQKMNELTLIVDKNNLQANLRTQDLIPLTPLEDKFKSFGCTVSSVDGHDLTALETTLRQETEGPHVVIANTIRGKGLPSIEDDPGSWFVQLTPDTLSQKIEELNAQ